MINKNVTFALFFGNRGFFPASLIAEAREELPRILKDKGYRVITLDKSATRYGAVESPGEGQVYANFLHDNRGKYDGVILCLPNFGDETGAVAALKEAGVPILIQAYPDDLDKMAPDLRRDSFCGKISIMDVFRQYNVKFTAFKPHVVKPSDKRFITNVDIFARICRVVNGMKKMIVGAIGARTTPFKTVRIDEIALQQNGITMETIDLSEIMARIKRVSTDEESYKDKANTLKEYTSWEGVPDKGFENIIKLGVVLDKIIEEYQMDAIALRCWIELQQQLGISPCVLLGGLNNRGLVAACEVDIGNAVSMYALHLASGEPAACLDWNNNYGDDDNKCILFHCGPVPGSLMIDKGKITDHAILANAVGQGSGYGCHVGRIKPFDFTFSSMLTRSGNLQFYLGHGKFTNEKIPSEYFGCAGVAEIEKLQDVLLHVGYNGHRHHVSVTPGLVKTPVYEALKYYLDFDVRVPQEE